MKKLTYIYIIIIIAFLSSCSTMKYTATKMANKSYIGMPITEFKTLSDKWTTLVAMESGYTVYKVYDYDALSGITTETKFFYFDTNAKLVKIDGGEFKQKRYQLEIINK